MKLKHVGGSWSCPPATLPPRARRTLAHLVEHGPGFAGSDHLSERMLLLLTQFGLAESTKRWRRFNRRYRFGRRLVSEYRATERGGRFHAGTSDK